MFRWHDETLLLYYSRRCRIETFQEWAIDLPAVGNYGRLRHNPTASIEDLRWAVLQLTTAWIASTIPSPTIDSITFIAVHDLNVCATDMPKY